MFENKTLQINIKKAIVIGICILFAYLFVFGGMNIIRANLDKDPQNGVQSATLGYMKDGTNWYDKEFELYTDEINTLSLPPQKTNKYYIYGDIYNYYKIEVFIDGKKINTVTASSYQRYHFWSTIYLLKTYVIELPLLEKNKIYEILLVSGNTSRKYKLKID